MLPWILLAGVVLLVVGGAYLIMSAPLIEDDAQDELE